MHKPKIAYCFRGRKMRTKAAVKYAATKLQEKGVLLVSIILPLVVDMMMIVDNLQNCQQKNLFQNIGDLPPNQLKNVQFIFLPLEQEGVFEVVNCVVGLLNLHSDKLKSISFVQICRFLQNLWGLIWRGWRWTCSTF